MSEVGDGPTFEEFVATRGRDLWRSAWLLTGDAHKAEDLVQTALLKCWRRWSSIANDGAVEAYVRRAMVTTYTDWWRQKWRSELPRGQRAVLVLRFYDDLTVAQTPRPSG